MTRRPILVLLLAGVVAVLSLVAIVVTRPSDPTARSEPSAAMLPTAQPTPVPIPGHEVYGFVPYWEMDEGIGAHLAATDLTTLALFSVTHRRDGTLDDSQPGHQRITGDLGRRLIAEARDRGTRTELVYTSFGERKNERLFTDPEAQSAAIDGLVALATDLEVDGINVDVELLAADHVPAYGAFVGRLRAALRQANPEAEVSVATQANIRGSAMAAAAAQNGADRIFLMGYDYRVGDSDPGASAPLDRNDGNIRDLQWSLDLYATAGVPVERTLLGLPLYGMTWPVVAPWPGAPRTGAGEAWEPGENRALLADPSNPPSFDPVESVEFLALPTGENAWEAIYYDSPQSLTPKLALADARGLAGAGFWALGYERGLPGYTELIAAFRAGELEPAAR